jgi:hypothetical protein
MVEKTFPPLYVSKPPNPNRWEQPFEPCYLPQKKGLGNFREKVLKKKLPGLRSNQETLRGRWLGIGMCYVLDCLDAQQRPHYLT